jgi:hypothetical protein
MHSYTLSGFLKPQHSSSLTTTNYHHCKPFSIHDFSSGTRVLFAMESLVQIAMCHFNATSPSRDLGAALTLIPVFGSSVIDIGVVNASILNQESTL